MGLVAQSPAKALVVKRMEELTRANQEIENRIRELEELSSANVLNVKFIMFTFNVSANNLLTVVFPQPLFPEIATRSLLFSGIKYFIQSS